jgi:glycosyltransferase involved in cell wall biosynthesis
MADDKIRLLILLTKRQPPSSRLRMTACLDEFRGRGVEPEVLPIPSDPLGRLKMLFRARSADAIILQKKTSFKLYELKLLQRANANIIFDMDDAVMFHELEHGQPLTGKNLLKFLRTINHCKGVVAGNDFLARFAEPNCSKVLVLPTPIDTGLYRPKDCSEQSARVCVGWLGVAGNLRYLDELAPVFVRLAEKYPGFYLKIVSNRFVDIPGVPIEKELWNLESEQASLRSFDIGIMPLDDSLWARGKCGYKLLQYMGVAVPVVASPVGINTEFVQDGVNGFLARNHEEWFRYLSQLIESREQRVALGRQGECRVRESYSRHAYVARYSDFIKNILSGG